MSSLKLPRLDTNTTRITNDITKSINDSSEVLT